MRLVQRIQSALSRQPDYDAMSPDEMLALMERRATQEEKEAAMQLAGEQDMNNLFQPQEDAPVSPTMFSQTLRRFIYSIAVALSLVVVYLLLYVHGPLYA